MSLQTDAVFIRVVMALGQSMCGHLEMVETMETVVAVMAM